MQKPAYLVIKWVSVRIKDKIASVRGYFGI
jgi:hypothetical protein